MMRKFVVKYIDGREKKQMENNELRKMIVEGSNMPQAIRSFYAKYGNFGNELHAKEIYELSGMSDM